jgi:hypothetical protein
MKISLHTPRIHGTHGHTEVSQCEENERERERDLWEKIFTGVQGVTKASFP